MNEKWIEEIKRNDEMTMLDRYFPRESAASGCSEKARLASETAQKFNDSGTEYVFQAGNNECEKCRNLDGIKVSEETWQNERKMNSLGFWKQFDGVYKPHPHCRCTWQKTSTYTTMQIANQISRQKQVYTSVLTASKHNVKFYAEETRNNLLLLTQNPYDKQNYLLMMAHAIQLMTRFFIYTSSEYDILNQKIQQIKNWISSNVRNNELMVSAMDWIATRELELKNIRPISKKAHYERLNINFQKIKYLPKSPQDAINKGFKKAPDSESRYHGLHLGNHKYYNLETGQEVVFDKDGNIVEDESLAEKVMIRELDENGVLIRETTGYFNQKKETGPLRITKEELDRLIELGYKPKEEEYILVDEDDNNLSK